MTGTANQDYGDDFARYEPVPGPMAHGPYDDLNLEARRLSRLVRACLDRDTIAARRAEGWIPVDEALHAAEVHQVNGSRAPYRDYAAGADKFRAEAEAFRANHYKNRRAS
jgi:hypothetical protein